MIYRCAVLAMLAACSPARGAEPVLKMATGPGRAETVAACTSCHSSAYIVMNSVFLSADEWRVEVSKMRTAFGAPISDQTADEISTYLGQNYGVSVNR